MLFMMRCRAPDETTLLKPLKVRRQLTKASR